MKPFERIGKALSPDGTVLQLVRRDDEYVILAGGQHLMSSRMHGSEESLAALGCRQAGALSQPAVLIGGLGMGFTLRAALKRLPAAATVVVAELVAEVVEWNRGALGPLAGHPLDDPRVRVEIGDVTATLRSGSSSGEGRFDAVLLDVDNGPGAFTDSGNAALYGETGIAAALASLRPDGVLAVWSAREDRKFEQRLRNAGFSVQLERVRGHAGKSAHHTIYLAQRSQPQP
jgi:spermidine synthase